MSLTAEALLAAVALRQAQVEVCGLKLTLREMSLDLRNRLAGKDNVAAAVLVVQECVVDDAGRPVLNAEQAQQLAQSSAKSLDQIMEQVMKLSGVGEDAGKD